MKYSNFSKPLPHEACKFLFMADIFDRKTTMFFFIFVHVNLSVGMLPFTCMFPLLLLPCKDIFGCHMLHTLSFSNFREGMPTKLKVKEKKINKEDPCWI